MSKLDTFGLYLCIVIQKVQAMFDLFISSHFNRADEVRALIEDLDLDFIGEDSSAA